jgi:hypothetical protein
MHSHNRCFYSSNTLTNTSGSIDIKICTTPFKAFSSSKTRPARDCFRCANSQKSPGRISWLYGRCGSRWIPNLVGLSGVTWSEVRWGEVRSGIGKVEKSFICLQLCTTLHSVLNNDRQHCVSEEVLVLPRVFDNAISLKGGMSEILMPIEPDMFVKVFDEWNHLLR